jgi:hypothetical protein
MQAIGMELGSFLEEMRPRLLAITEGRASEKPFPEKWSLKEILGHLIDSGANNHQRIVRMQERPDIGAFTYSQQHWVNCQHYQDRPWNDLVELWCQLNRHLAHVIAHIDPATLTHSCDMGYAAPASLRFVVEDYLRHVRHHMEQILSDSNPRERRKWVARSPQA